MLKTILNFKGTEILSKEGQKYIFGRGTGVHPVCSDGNWAPVGANPANYPNYPCADIYEPVVPVPCKPMLLPDGTVSQC
ncbi:hypothetical protein [Flavobacterium sp. N2038]|jgi:hypothetical protein|uniref:hypothetical protein n=1 Tax=Flavobacterium sp. N2038 TaxID=2986829 RepID=UPI00222497AD|nr:hypothetical protein [Flavobacterium sp. N2038]